VPASFTTTRSASASVVDVAAVSPSMIFISVAVAVTPSRIFSSLAVDVIATPPIDSVEKLPVEAVVAPIVVLSIEPAFISAVVATKELNVPAAAVVPPMVVLSIVPALMSAVSATRLSMFAVPSI
jgi:hypothetical protein